MSLSVLAAGCSDGTEEPSMLGPGSAARNASPAAPASIPGLLHAFQQVVDLTQALSENTPVLSLPAPFANTAPFSREVVSNFDAAGPGWAWYDFAVGEHVGTHFDAPCHWITGRDKACVDDVPTEDLVGPAVVIDVRAPVATNPDYLVTVEDALAWERRHGRIPARSWVLLRTGWADRYDNASQYLNGGHWPGPSEELVHFLIERDVLGVGVETVGTDAGVAHSFAVPFPNHHFMLGAGRYGLTSLTNLDRLPPRGAVLIAAPLKLKDGTGSPVRVLALVP